MTSSVAATCLRTAGMLPGGKLALVLSRLATERKPAKGVIPVGAVAFSPVTDLTLSGQTWKTRAVADPYFIESQARELVRSYLNGADPTDPQASPLFVNSSVFRLSACTWAMTKYCLMTLCAMSRVLWTRELMPRSMFGKACRMALYRVWANWRPRTKR